MYIKVLLDYFYLYDTFTVCVKCFNTLVPLSLTKENKIEKTENHHPHFKHC